LTWRTFEETIRRGRSRSIEAQPVTGGDNIDHLYRSVSATGCSYSSLTPSGSSFWNSNFDWCDVEVRRIFQT